MEQETNLTPKRTTFLTVLCILTFIGSGLGIISSVSNIFTADVSSKVFESMEESIDNAAASSTENTEETQVVEELTDSTVADTVSADVMTEEVNEAVNEVVEEMNEAQMSDKSTEAAANMMKSLVGGMNAEAIKNNAYASILAAVLTLMGAILMWKLRKVGFWVYVLGTIISIVAPLIIYSGNLIGAFTAIGFGFFGLLFIVLYAINKKQLVY